MGRITSYNVCYTKLLRRKSNEKDDGNTCIKKYIIRIYMRPKGGETDFKEPLIAREGDTVEDVCNKLHRHMKKQFRYGMVRMVDVGLIPKTREQGGTTQKGFKIFLGGGLGNKSFVGHQLEEFTPEEDLLYRITSYNVCYTKLLRDPV